MTGRVTLQRLVKRANDMHWSLLARSWAEPVQIAGDGGELVGIARLVVCTFTLEPQTLDFLVSNYECDGHGLDAYASSPCELDRMDQKSL